MGDGTVLLPGVGGDTIADEDLSGQPRQSPAVPAAGTSYKIPRTKIAIGDYGQDRGDASPEGAGLPVEDNRARRIAEANMIRASDVAQLARPRRASEREPVFFFGRSSRDGRA